ncbi:MAG TPA: hypothetical protein VK968_17765, partial [Roseimicrobium sp.]|nr:hypothetical protein [Roseimicrobium sp.]
LNNLKQIGTAYKIYSGDNSDKLPYAAVHYTSGGLAWDDLIDSYIGGTQETNQTYDHGRTYFGKAPGVIKCPADKVPVNPGWSGLSASAVRKSYAPPRFDTTKASNFPVNTTATTGTGLHWSWASWQLVTGRTNGWPVGEPTAGPPYNNNNTAKNLPSVREAMLLDGPGTIMITEYIDMSTVWASAECNPSMGSANDHIGSAPSGISNTSARLHGPDSFNYLFSDGHVEFLSRVKTLGKTNVTVSLVTGMWSITSTD